MKRSLITNAGLYVFLVFVLVGLIIVPKAFAQEHDHEYSVFVSYEIENGKVYEVKECDCKETNRTEMENAVGATTETAQSILDNIEEGKIIVLDSGNYGNLYIRKNDSSINYESDWAGGQANTTFKRTIKDVTILGTPGTVVSSIIAEAATYPKGTEHSLSDVHEYLNTYIDIQNLTIKNITFTPEENKVAVALANSGYKVSINGLTIDGCTVNGTGTLSAGNRLFMSEVLEAKVHTILGVEVLVENRKNITIKNCVMNNLHQGVKINYVENLTISNNQFNNVKGRDLLIGGGSGNIAGNIQISNNTSDGATERFMRLAVLSGNLSVLNNVVTNNNGADVDIVKVTYKAETNPTVVFGGNSWEGLSDTDAKESGVIVY